MDGRGHLLADDGHAYVFDARSGDEPEGFFLDGIHLSRPRHDADSVGSGGDLLWGAHGSSSRARRFLSVPADGYSHACAGAP
jgi:hypothetical protein